MDFLTLHLLFKCGQEYRHRRVRDCGLSDTECLICSFLYSHAGCSQDDVVQGLRMDKTTAAKALQSLEAKGCIERTQDAEDRRKKLLQLTDSGTDSVSSILHLHDAWLNGLMSCLSPEEQAQFEHCCTRLLQAAEAQLSGRSN